MNFGVSRENGEVLLAVLNARGEPVIVERLCLDELDFTFDWRPSEGRYWCRLKDGKGRFVEDQLMEYRRPNERYIESLRYPALPEE